MWRIYSYVKCLVTPQTRGLRVRQLSVSARRCMQQVLVSTSTNIFENLALEDWLFEHHDLDTSPVLLMYKNAPCVVIGRHQNPWVECHVPGIAKFGLHLARRKSGGGTVYHDEGNLNCSFLVPTTQYDRKKNLQLVIDALKSRWDVQLEINKKDDIIMDHTYKISGTASRLKRHRSYHHFTLLLNVDKHRLQSILYSNMTGVSSNATQSTRMQVANLSDTLPNVDFDSVVHAVTEQALKNTQSQDVEYVDPMDDDQFPGIQEVRQEFQSWEWTFGKTPNFSIHRRFHNTIGVDEMNVEIKTNIIKGCIDHLQFDLLASVEIDPQVVVSLRVGLQEVRLESTNILSMLTQIKMDWIANGQYTVKTSQVLDWLLLCIIETLCH